jgi:TonB-linked SusC/RagA family outer membrane protein
MKSLITVLALLLVSAGLNAQSIRGRVIDTSGEPITGAAITYENTKNGGTVSDIDGRFTIDGARAGKYIEVSSIGYTKQKVAVGTGGKEILVTLAEDNTNLDEVVVLGYEKQGRRSLLGTVSSITPDILQNYSGQNVADVLQGRIAGLEIAKTSGLPGAAQSFTLRGKNSISIGDEGLNITNEPLIIIDGVPFINQSISPLDIGAVGAIGPLATLSSDQIERIDVLKDADATSIYGSRGANGVIHITTKKNKEGRLRIDAQLSTGIVRVANFSNDLLNTEEYLDIRRKAFEADGLTPSASNAYDILEWGDKYHTNWQKELAGGTGAVHNAALNISGGGGNTHYYVTADYYQTGNVFLALNDDKSERFNSKILVNHLAWDGKLNITASLAFNTFDQKTRGGLSPGTIGWYLYNLPPNQPVYNEDGSLYYYDNSSYNPVSYKYSDLTNKNISTLGNFQAEYKISKELSASVHFGYTHNTAQQLQTKKKEFYNPHADNTIFNEVQDADSYSDTYIVEPLINYRKDFGGNSSLLAFVGATYQSETNNYQTLILQNFPSELRFRDYGSATQRGAVTGNYDPQIRTSVFGRAAYNLHDKYLFSANLRRDGSSVLAPGNRFANFWSLAGGWIFSNETLVKDNVGFLDYGKIKFSYGTSGVDNITSGLYLNGYNSSTSTQLYGGSSGMYLSQLGNNNLTWEVTKKAELSLYLVLLKNRLQITTSLYRNQTDNLLTLIPLASQAGLSSYKGNLEGATLRSQGLEVELLSTNLQLKDFSWTSLLTLTVPDNNRVIKFDNLENSVYAESIKVGESINAKTLYHYTGIDPETGIPQVEDVNKDGSITYSTATDLQFFEDTDPDFYGGFQNSFRYKNLQLDVYLFFESRPFQEGYLSNQVAPGLIGNYSRKYTTGYWTQPGDNSTLPRLTTYTSSGAGYEYIYRYCLSDAVYEDASYISLKNVTLSYYLPQSWIKKAGANSIRLFAKGENLKTFTSYSLWSPETKSAIPPLQTITAGISVSF